MKLKQFCSIIVSVLLLGGCAESVDTSQPTGSGQVSRNDSLPVAFDAYQNRTITRSGWAGVLENTQLKETKANGGGFGVFAYYTDLKNYDQTYVPNFMYNRGVFWKGENGTIPEDYWAYSPIVYWPNEYGFDAASDDEDHLSFFAYAPYTPHVSAAAGSVADATYGIVGFSRNTATGDPMVRYIASFEPEKSVDLCWGVVPSDKTAWPKIQGGSTQTLAAGFPYLNMERPLETATQAGASSSSRIKFKFNHALAQLNVQIDTDADVTSHYDAGDELGAETKVYVRSISFTGIALQGALNLNNSVKDQALWLDWCGCTDLAYGQSVTVHDGRRDSREGAAGAEAANETPTGLNPNIIQNSTATPGVIHEYQNLFKTTSTDPATALQEAICVIPTGEAMTITIVYDVETTNPKLASYLSDGTTHGSSIENKITKTVTFGGVAGAGLESNKRYALKLHLGMNSVKFDAEVSDWATNTVNGEGWLPSNVRPITLNHTTMYLGNTTNLIATTDPVGQSVTWTNSDPAVVSLGGVVASTRAGTRAVTTLPGTWSTINVTPLALGDATITASLPSGDKAVCEVHVVPIVLTSPNNTTPSNAITETVGKKATVRLEASLFPATGSPSVTWTASPAGFVTLTPVSGDPTKCDVYGDAVGDVVITAQNGTYPTTATCNMSVTSQPPTVVNPVLTANWTYDTNAHDLITTAGTVTGGTMYYSLDGANWFANYNDAALQKTNAGSYPVYYKVKGSAGYDDIPQTLIGTVLVSKATPTITLSANSGTVKALARDYQLFDATLTTDAVSEGAVLTVTSSSTNIATATPANPASGGNITVKGASVGSTTTTTIRVSSSATSNYNAAAPVTYTVTVNPISTSLNPLTYVDNANVSGSYGTATVDHTTTYGDLYRFSEVNKINIQAGYANKHVPSRAEWEAIVPASKNSSENLMTRNGSFTLNVPVGGESGTITDKSYWDTSTEPGVVRAIRFIDTDHSSAWTYKFNGDDLVISCVLIEKIDPSDAATWMSNHSSSWNSLFSGYYLSNKTLEACGYGDTSGNLQDGPVAYWTKDMYGSSARGSSLSGSRNDNILWIDDSGGGCAVRLFDNW